MKGTTFSVTEAIVEQFVRFAEKEYDVKIDRQGLMASKRLIKQYIKSELARQIWVEQGFYQVNNLVDPEVQKAIEVLR